jgi:DMSO/TMAO reductase YedYZ molybdopterin-dependent catalytic subunit
VEPSEDPRISPEELQLATRNHGMPLEALRWDRTPVGLHYLLIHYDIPAVDPAAWRLEVGGRVTRPLSLSLDDLRAQPARTVGATMECAGNGRARLRPRPISQPWLLEAVGTADWTGVPLAAVLDEAGLDPDAEELVFTGLDRGVEGGVPQAYQRALTAADAADALLAYEINGQPLPPQHGAPLRLVVPGWYGMTNVKWLGRIEAVDEPFAGYQHERAYLIRQHEDEPGVPATRMVPRSLMVPPGVPDFLTRRRFVTPGPCPLEGRAWSGWAPIESVAVSTDGGASWTDAEVTPDPEHPAAWSRWTWTWEAEPGEHVLCCRARDGAGHEQPVATPWNLGGYANNEVHRVPVTVG